MSHKEESKICDCLAHCRCMNLGGQCPNTHYADCLKKSQAKIAPSIPGFEWAMEFDKKCKAEYGKNITASMHISLKSFISSTLERYKSSLVGKCEERLIKAQKSYKEFGLQHQEGEISALRDVLTLLDKSVDNSA